MLIDLTLPVSQSLWEQALRNERLASLGHLGTHFDAMDRPFALENIRRRGRLVNARGSKDREIATADLGNLEIRPNDAVLFHTGFLKDVGYGKGEYFRDHPQLSMELIHHLLDARVSLIGIDAAGMRRGAEHTPTDQACADRGTFVLENLYNLDVLQQAAAGRPFTVYTFPLRFEGLTGLPCRVVAEV